MKAGLSLTRSNQDDREVAFRLRLDTGRTVTMTMTPHDFAMLITGMSDVDCEVTTRRVQLVVEPRTTVEQATLDHIAATNKQDEIDRNELRGAALGEG